MKIAVLLFDDFETLDVYGPVEIFGRLTDQYTIVFYSINGGIIHNKHGVLAVTENLDKIPNDLEIFIIPGGIGTRNLVTNKLLIDKIRVISNQSKFVLTICTGSALLAKTGLLDGKTATSNKKAFSWVQSNGENVFWNKKARWTVDGKFYTSSGVSAGIDMALGFLTNQFGYELAKQLANDIEYIWNEEISNDLFIAE